MAQLITDESKQAFVKQAEEKIEAKHATGEHTHHLSEAVSRIEVLAKAGSPINETTIAKAVQDTQKESYPNLPKEKFTDATKLLTEILEKTASKQAPGSSVENITAKSKSQQQAMTL